MKVKMILAISVLVISLYACNSNNSSSNNAIEQTPVNDAIPNKVKINGQDIFEQKCATCHGSDGMAGIGNAANLQASKLDSISIAKMIANGKGEMPSFKGQLTKEELNDLSNYVIALRK